MPLPADALVVIPVKGKIVISYSRVSLPLLSLMYSIYTPLGLNPNDPFPLYSFITVFNFVYYDLLMSFKQLKWSCYQLILFLEFPHFLFSIKNNVERYMDIS